MKRDKLIVLLLVIGLCSITIAFIVPSKNRRRIKIEVPKVLIIQYAEEAPDSQLK